MNIIKITLSFLVLVNCIQPLSSKSQGHENILIKSNENIDTVKSILSGSWINKKYADKLLESKSPKETQNVVPLTMLTFPVGLNENVDLIWGFHEGTSGILKKQNELYYIQYQEDGQFDSIIFLTDNTIRFKNDEFLKLDDSVDFGDPHLVEQIFFSGMYDWNGRQIKFTQDGKVIGLDSISYYSVLIDYYDAGMDVDQLRLGNNFNESDLYGFRFLNNSLFIYQLTCLIRHEDFCYKVEYGPLIYKLNRE